MPNHVGNIVTATDPKVLAALVKEEDGEKIIDFGLVIPIPDDDDPRITATKHDYGNGMVGYSMDGKSPMDFARDMWGTKWNAYSQVVDDRTTRLEFDTAWSHPFPVIEALSRQFPDEPIHVQYADEDLGSNLGEYTILNGNIIDDATPGDPAARLDFAAMVKYGQTYAALEAEWGEED